MDVLHDWDHPRTRTNQSPSHSHLRSIFGTECRGASNRGRPVVVLQHRHTHRFIHTRLSLSICKCTLCHAVNTHAIRPTLVWVCVCVKCGSAGACVSRAKKTGETDRGSGGLRRGREGLNKDLVDCGSFWCSTKPSLFVSLLLLVHCGCSLNRKLKPQAEIIRPVFLPVFTHWYLWPFTTLT